MARLQRSLLVLLVFVFIACVFAVKVGFSTEINAQLPKNLGGHPNPVEMPPNSKVYWRIFITGRLTIRYTGVFLLMVMSFVKFCLKASRVI